MLVKVVDYCEKGTQHTRTGFFVREVTKGKNKGKVIAKKSDGVTPLLLFSDEVEKIYECETKAKVKL